MKTFHPFLPDDRHHGERGDGIGPPPAVGGGTILNGAPDNSGDSAGTKNPSATDVEEGRKLSESGRPDSNRRRPAWEASDPSADQRPPA